MSKRHARTPGDWESAAARLDEIISAHSGEDAFEEALTLLVAKLAHEVSANAAGDFLGGIEQQAAAREVNTLLHAASQRWPDILPPSAATRLSGPELLRCAAVLRPLRLLAEHLVGLDAIFESIVNKASKGQKGQYFTPRHVIAEVVAMLRPQPGEHVADPACGSGGFLRHALMHQPRCHSWGFDQDPRAARVARVMLTASGQPASHVTRIDSLERSGIESCMQAQQASAATGAQFTGFDVILSNPPFAGDVGEQYASSYELAQGKHVERDVLFVERCVSLLRPGGRLAIVLPHNKVAAAPWAYMRHWLLQRVKLLAVVGLGRNTFQPHTSQKACVIIGQKRATPAPLHPEEEILFFISERDGKDARGRLVYAADSGSVDHDLGEATALVRERFARLQAGG